MCKSSVPLTLAIALHWMQRRPSKHTYQAAYRQADLPISCGVLAATSFQLLSALTCRLQRRRQAVHGIPSQEDVEPGQVSGAGRDLHTHIYLRHSLRAAIHILQLFRCC